MDQLFASERRVQESSSQAAFLPRHTAGTARKISSKALGLKRNINFDPFHNSSPGGLLEREEQGETDDTRLAETDPTDTKNRVKCDEESSLLGSIRRETGFPQRRNQDVVQTETAKVTQGQAVPGTSSTPEDIRQSKDRKPEAENIGPKSLTFSDSEQESLASLCRYASAANLKKSGSDFGRYTSSRQRPKETLLNAPSGSNTGPADRVPQQSLSLESLGETCNLFEQLFKDSWF